jgi:outer membrane protein
MSRVFNKQRALALLAGLWVGSLQADTVLGLTTTVDVWDMDSDGAFADSNTLTDFDHGSETPIAFSFALEHPVPMVPNFQLRFTDLSSSGRTNLESSFEFDGVTYPVNARLGTEFNLQSSDFIFYYELLDNDTVSFDLGLNGKYLDGEIEVSDGTQRASESFTGVVPMLYGAFEFGIPSSRISFFGDINFLSFGDHTLRDFQAGATYTLVDNMAVDFSVRGGYRRFNLELDDLDGIHADWTFDGLFLGVEADF